MTAHVDPVAWARKQKRIRIVLTIVIGTLAFGALTFYLLKNHIIPAIRYADAEQTADRGGTQDAIDRFSLLGSYRDASDRAAALAYAQEGNELYRDVFASAEPGDVVEFGRYEQDGRTNNGAEPIRWLVVEKDGNRLLLLSVMLLEERPYHDRDEDVTWESCSLRAWLNDTFAKTAFTEAERALIAKTRLDNADNPAGHSKGGRDTEDHIYVLSFDEIASRLRDPVFLEGLHANPSAHVNAQGAEHPELYKAGSWWARTPGFNQRCAVFCNQSGAPLYSSYVYKKGYAVRPAIRVFTAD